MELKQELTEDKVYEMLEEIRLYVVNNYNPKMREKVEAKCIEISHYAWHWRHGG